MCTWCPRTCHAGGNDRDGDAGEVATIMKTNQDNQNQKKKQGYKSGLGKGLRISKIVDEKSLN